MLCGKRRELCLEDAREGRGERNDQTSPTHPPTHHSRSARAQSTVTSHPPTPHLHPHTHHTSAGGLRSEQAFTHPPTFSRTDVKRHVV